jgi:tetratricopeptide (TPR) repeat protein
MAKLAQLPANDRTPAPTAARAGHAPGPQIRYFAFLSYSHKDEEIADWLYGELEDFRVPPALAGRLTGNGVIPKRLTPIFRDEHELAAADDLGEEIQGALRSSQFLIVLCSPDAAKSHWTNAEIETFKRTRPDGCVLAAIAAGEPFASEMPGREDEECFPPALRERYDRRGRPTGKRAEPLAADLRESGDGRRLGFLKLVAGMLGVGLDDLVQRETTRRHRRLAWLTAASIAGMAVTSTLAVTAIQARDSARDQRRQAEGLVAFMLGDLKDKLEPIGKLDALDGVGSRVLAYYSKQDTSDLSDAGLLQRSRALGLMAKVAYARGNADAASALDREALEATAEAVRRSPNDPNRLYEHAQNIFWVGEIARRRGQLKPAEAAYREYKRLADQMAAIEPDNLRWRMEVLYANENLGIALFDERRFGEATRQFEATIRPMESAAAIDSRNATYQKEFANLVGWLSRSYGAEGRLDAENAARIRQISLLNQIAASNAGDVRFQEKLITAHHGLGILLASLGHADQAVEQLQRAASYADRLIPAEPENRLWRRYAAMARLELGKTLLAEGQVDSAAQAARGACAMTAALKGRDPNADKWRRLQTDCLTLRARLASAAGSTGDAISLARQAIEVAKAGTGDPMSGPYVLAGAYRLLGDLYRRDGDAHGAASAWAAGLAAIPRNVTERPWEIYEHEQLLARLGRGDEAQPLSAKLRAMGYRSVT